MSSAICFNLDQSKILSSGNVLTLCHIIPTMNNPEKESFKKHCAERRKYWLPAFSPFPTMFSTHSKENILLLSGIYFVICKCFEFGPV